MDSTSGAPFGLQYRAWRCRQLLWRDRTSILAIAVALLCCAWRLAAPTCALGPAAVASQHAAEAARAQRDFWLASYVVRAAASADAHAAAAANTAASASQCASTSCQHWPWEWRVTCGCWLAGVLKPRGWAPGMQRLLSAATSTVLQVVVGPFTLGGALGSLLTLGAMVSIIPYVLLMCVPLPGIQPRGMLHGRQLRPLLQLRGWQLVWHPPGWYWLAPGVREGGTAAYRLFLSALQLASMGPYRAHELLFAMFPCGQWRHLQYVFKSWHGVLQVLPPRLQLACCMVEWVLTLALVAALEPGLLSMMPAPPPTAASAAAVASCSGWLHCLLAAPLVQHAVSSLVLVVGVPTAAAWVLEQGMRSRWRAVCTANNVSSGIVRPNSSKQKGCGRTSSSSDAGSRKLSSMERQCSSVRQDAPAGAPAHVALGGIGASSGDIHPDVCCSSPQQPGTSGVPGHMAAAEAAAAAALEAPQVPPHPQPQLAPLQQHAPAYLQTAPPQGLTERLGELLGPAAASSIMDAWEASLAGPDSFNPAVYVSSSVLLPVGIKVDAAHSRVDELEPALLRALQGALQATTAPSGLQQQQQAPSTPRHLALVPLQGKPSPRTQCSTGDSYALQAVCFPGCVHLLGCVYTPSCAWQLQQAARGALQATLVAQVQQGLRPACDGSGLPPIAAVVGTAAAATAAAAAVLDMSTPTAGSTAPCLVESCLSVEEQCRTSMHLPATAAAATATLAVDMCCIVPPVYAAHYPGQQWVTLYLSLTASESVSTRVANSSGCEGTSITTSSNANSSVGSNAGSGSSSSGSNGHNAWQGHICRLLVFSQQQVVVEQVMPLAPVLRFCLPPLSPGAYHLAILPAAAAADTAGGAAAGVPAAAASSSSSLGSDSSAAPWVLQPLLALPAPAAAELQRHWQRLCRAAGAQQCHFPSSASEQGVDSWHPSTHEEGCGAVREAPDVAVEATVWRSVWAGLMRDLACTICNTPPGAQHHPHPAQGHTPPAPADAPGAAAAGRSFGIPAQPAAAPPQQQQLLVGTLQVLMPYLTQVGLCATAQYLMEQLQHNA